MLSIFKKTVLSSLPKSALITGGALVVVAGALIGMSTASYDASHPDSSSAAGSSSGDSNVNLHGALAGGGIGLAFDVVCVGVDMGVAYLKGKCGTGETEPLMRQQP